MIVASLRTTEACSSLSALLDYPARIISGGAPSLVDIDAETIVLHDGELTMHEWWVWRHALMVRGAITLDDQDDLGLPVVETGGSCVEFLRAYRQHREPAVRYADAFPSLPGIGSLRPNVILVGEQPNPRTLERTRSIPFAYGGAGQWLTAAIGIDSELRTRRIYVTNAIKSDGDDITMPREIRYLQHANAPHVIALGKIAGAALDRKRIEHVVIDHPQHARRFHHHEPYSNQLREALRTPHGHLA